MKRESRTAKDEITRARAVARMLELSERSQGELGEKTWTRDELHERHPTETRAASISNCSGEEICREELRRSLQNPHPESADLAEQGMDEWSRGLPEEDAESLVDSSAGRPVRWVPGEGWTEDSA